MHCNFEIAMAVTIWIWNLSLLVTKHAHTEKSFYLVMACNLVLEEQVKSIFIWPVEVAIISFVVSHLASLDLHVIVCGMW